MATNVTSAERPKVDAPATPERPVYYRVAKATAYYAQQPYDLTWKDVEKLSRYKSASAWQGFATREEAIAFAEARGWTKVSSWKEAEKLAAPALAAIAEARAARAKAADEATFVTYERITELVEALAPGGEHLKVWVGKDGQLRARRAQGY